MNCEPNSVSPETHAPNSVPEQAIRDLMGLLALPALWAGRDAETVLQVMIEAAERIVPLSFTFARTRPYVDKPQFDLLRSAGQYRRDYEAADWQRYIEEWDKSPAPEGRPSEHNTPLGLMRTIRLSLGFGTYGGKIWFGSMDPSFPTFNQLAFLKAASSLAATGIQAARANAEREQASRAKDEFLAMLGHELRNPLAPITTALELLKLRNGDELPREYQIIERQAQHLARLVDDLMDVSRITRGKIALRPERVDLNHILTRALEDTQPLFESLRHSLSINLPEEEVWVFGDAVRLTQIFSNLLTNAAKYTDPGGQICVRMQVSGTQVITSVRDNGSGISPDLLPRVFTIFEQGKTTIDRGKGGLGIGLALVKNFTELHGGKVTAVSGGLGQGAEFIVTLPLLQNALPDHNGLAVSTQERPLIQPVRILLVDDNIDALRSLDHYLTSCGHTVRSASDSHEALRIANEFSPEIAVLDIGLPILDGYALAEKFREHPSTRSVRLIALTGYGQPQDLEKSRTAGFDIHLVKPVLLQDLNSAIAQLLI